MKNKVILLLILVLIAGCDKKTFLVTKDVLDPFTVYSHNPLSLPPIYYLSSQEVADERRFIKEGEKRVQSLLFESQMQVVLPSKKTSVTFKSTDEEFLKLAQADKDLSTIRDKLDEESLGLVSKDSNFIKRIFSDYKGEGLDDKLSEYKKYNS